LSEKLLAAPNPYTAGLLCSSALRRSAMVFMAAGPLK
jgi:hypothetical protein